MLYQQISANKRKTVVVVVVYLLLFLVIGAALGEYSYNNAVSEIGRAHV